MTPIKSIGISLSEYLYYYTEQLVTSSNLTVHFILVKALKIFFYVLSYLRTLKPVISFNMFFYYNIN